MLNVPHLRNILSLQQRSVRRILREWHGGMMDWCCYESQRFGSTLQFVHQIMLLYVVWLDLSLCHVDSVHFASTPWRARLAELLVPIEAVGWAFFDAAAYTSCFVEAIFSCRYARCCFEACCKHPFWHWPDIQPPPQCAARCLRRSGLFRQHFTISKLVCFGVSLVWGPGAAMVRGAGCERLPYLFITITSLHNPAPLHFTCQLLSAIVASDSIIHIDSWSVSNLLRGIVSLYDCCEIHLPASPCKEHRI